MSNYGLSSPSELRCLFLLWLHRDFTLLQLCFCHLLLYIECIGFKLTQLFLGLHRIAVQSVRREMWGGGREHGVRTRILNTTRTSTKMWNKPLARPTIPQAEQHHARTVPTIHSTQHTIHSTPIITAHAAPSDRVRTLQRPCPPNRRLSPSTRKSWP